jgi:hypothetical protein
LSDFEFFMKISVQTKKHIAIIPYIMPIIFFLHHEYILIRYCFYIKLNTK